MENLTANERNEMIRAFAGLLTAKVAGDERATSAQMKLIIGEHATAAHGDPAQFVFRMGKQLEAGVVVAHMMLKMLTRRFDLSEAELQQALAELVTSTDLVQD